MKVKAQEILPSQSFLKEGTVAHIFSCLKLGEIVSLPPAPIVRRDTKGRLVAIDGHNLIAVRQFRGEAVEVHLASSSGDGLPPTNYANARRNQDLRDKFDRVLESQRRTSEEGINSFADLVAKYRDLFKHEATR